MATALQRLGPMLAPPLVSALCRTLRFEVTNPPNQPCVVAFWHGLMLAPWWLHRRTRSVALVSPSRDGQILTAALDSWGYTVVRGSSSDGGREALHRATALVSTGKTLLVTPDGPRGPACTMKRGAALVAARTGRPLVLMGVHYDRARRLGSWDRFAVPAPFSRVQVAYSDPIPVPNGLSHDDFDRFVADLSDELAALSDR